MTQQKVFDPQRNREFLDGPIGIQWCRDHDFEETKRNGALANSADMQLCTGIECLLVGYNEDALQILSKARDWLLAAIDLQEPPSNFDESLRFDILVRLNWLLEGKADHANMMNAINERDKYLARVGVDWGSVELELPMYLEANANQRVVDLYHEAGAKKKPKKINAIRSEGTMATVLARQRLGVDFTAEEAQVATEKFLQRFVPQSLNTGQYPSVARWMKLIHWNGEESHDAAKRALLCCYDYLPHVKRPT